MDLAVASDMGDAVPSVTRAASRPAQVVATERVYEHGYLKGLLAAVFERRGGAKLKTDNTVLNLALLSLMLDFGLFERHGGLLNLPLLECLKHGLDTKTLQVEVANYIFEFDKKTTADSVTRAKVEALIFECSYKFLVNKHFPVQSRQFELIRELNADPAYHPYLLLTKIYMSLCNINKSTVSIRNMGRITGRNTSSCRILFPREIFSVEDSWVRSTTSALTMAANINRR